MEAKFIAIQSLFKTLAQHYAHYDTQHYILVARLQSSLLVWPSCQAKRPYPLLCQAKHHYPLSCQAERHYPLQLWYTTCNDEPIKRERERVAYVNVCPACMPSQANCPYPVLLWYSSYEPTETERGCKYNMSVCLCAKPSQCPSLPCLVVLLSS